MAREPSSLDRDSTGYTSLLVVWTITVTVGMAVVFGNLFATEMADGAHVFSWGAAVGGAIFGLFSSIPFWVLLGFAKLLLRNVLKLRADIAQAKSSPTP